MNAATRARILAAAEAQGYSANPAARSLRKGSTNIVGFLFAPPEANSPLADVFFMDVVQGVQGALCDESLELVVLPCPTDDSPEAYVRRLVSRRFFDALIVMGGRDTLNAELVRSGVPVVGLAGSGGLSALVDFDHQATFADAITRLVNLGHTRVAAAPACPGRPVNAARVQHWLTPSTTEAEGRALGVELLSLDPLPTALIVENDAVAAGIYAALRTSGREPGRDLAVISCRSTARGRNLQPTPASYTYDPALIGAALARTVLGLLSGQPADGSVALAVGGVFVEGSSAGRPPV